MATTKSKKVAIPDRPSKEEKSPPVLSVEDREVLLRRGRNQDYVNKCKRLFTAASDARKRYDWTWLNHDLFRRGYHFSSFNPQTKTVALAKRSSGKVPINIVHAQMRTIKNQVTSIRPKWDVLPIGSNDSAKQNARYTGKLLDYYYDHLNLRRILKETIIQGLQYSVGGPWEILFNPQANGGLGDLEIWLIDPFDFYIDPNATGMDDAEYVGKAVRTSMEKIRANPDYNFYEDKFDIKGSTKQAASEYKQFLLQATRYYQSRGSDKEEETDILHEFWIKERVFEHNEEALAEELAANDEDNKDLRLGEVLMRKVTYLDSVLDPLDVSLYRRDHFPFAMMQADVNPMEVYGESWMKHVIPVNRVLDQLESSVLRYHTRYAIGRLVMDKNAGVRIVTNEHGDIIEKNAGSEVSALAVQPLPGSYQQQITNMRQYIEDIGGAHEASMGRIPTGVKSGVGIAELKSADAINQQDLIDGLEDFLVDVAGLLTFEISRHFDVPHVIRALGKSGEPEHFAVVGAAASKRSKTEVKIGGDVFDLAVIGDDNEVRVTIGSWLAHTRESRMEMLKEFVSMGIIDQQTFLELAEFGDVNEIIDRTRKDKLLEKFRSQPSAGAGGTEVSDEEIATQENHMMTIEGRAAAPGGVWPMPEDNHHVHLMIHSEALGASGNDQVEKHMLEHQRLIRLGKDEMAPDQPDPMMGGLPPQQPGMPGEGAVPPGMPGMPPEMMGMPGMPGAEMMPPPGGQGELPPELMMAMAGGAPMPGIA